MNTPKSVFKHSIPYFLILAIVSLLGLVVSDVFDIDTKSTIYQAINIGITVAVMVIAAINYRNKEQGGGITYGKAFTVSFVTAFMAMVISAILFFIYVSVISPDYLDTIVERELVKAEEKILTQNPDISDEQLEQTLGFSKSFMSPIMMTVFMVLFGAFFSAIVALITSIFIMKKGGINYALDNDSLDDESLS